MSTICLSLAPNLRCESVTHIQDIVLLIPPALELIFSIGLVASRWGSSREHLFLAAEGVSFLVLALLDFLSHVVPDVRSSLITFKVADIFMGTASFVPLLFYTVFLYSFSVSNLIPMLPKRYYRIPKYTLLLFMPTLIVLNEFASLLGISYRVISGPTTLPTLSVGFANDSAEGVWTFFSSCTLALLTVFQAIVFSLAFFQLIKAFINQRHIETSGREENEVHLFKGIGWMALGLKLGAIETVIGFAIFANGGFGAAMTRRIIRLIARACLIIGVVKGIDSVEDFSMFRAEKRRSRLLISNPRTSTFKRMSQYATDFYSRPRARDNIGNGPTTPATSTTTVVNQSSFIPFDIDDGKVVNESRTRRSSWVTVRQEPGSAPAIDLRFSPLDIPSAEMIAVTTQARPGHMSRYSFGGTLLGQKDFPTPTLTMPRPAARGRDRPPPPPLPPIVTSVMATIPNSGNRKYVRNDNAYLPRASVMSANSLASDSLSVVREISSQFPGLPPRVTGKYRGSVLGATVEEANWISGANVRPLGVAQRNPSSPKSSMMKESMGRRKPPPLPSPITLSGPYPRINRSSLDSSVFSQTPRARSERTFTGDQNTYMRRNTLVSEPYTRDSELIDGRPRGSRLGMPWLENDTNAEIIVEGRAELDDVWEKTAPGLVSIKGVGRIARRRTPTPTHSSFTRESMSAMQAYDDLPAISMVTSIRPTSRNVIVRRDSGVFGDEDQDIMRRSMAVNA